MAVDVHDDRRGEHQGAQEQGDPVAPVHVQPLHGFCLAAVVAAALHGHGQLVRAAEAGDEKRHQSGSRALARSVILPVSKSAPSPSART